MSTLELVLVADSLLVVWAHLRLLVAREREEALVDRLLTVEHAAGVLHMPHRGCPYIVRDAEL